MTTSPTPGQELDPAVLASAVPLKRVGTEEVRHYVPFIEYLKN